jgi:hypothetical protein
MRKFMLLLSLVALVAPIAAFADAAPTPAQTANQICSQERTTTLGPAAFTQTYGTNASKSNASCKAQQADANFAAEAGHDNKTFDQFYGKNGKGNAFGKCVSQAVQSTVAATAKASAAALKSCKALRKSNLALFTQQNGTGKDALGKCVSKASTSK